MLTFANPNILWGLLLLSVPILIHLLSRKWNAPLVFPSTRFLQNTRLPREGRTRLQDRLLLLNRLLLLSFLILLLANPSWQIPMDNAEENPGEKQAFFLLDASASMQGTGCLENGKQLALNALETLKGWQIGGGIYSGEILDSTPIQDGTSEIKQLFDRWKPDFSAGSPAKALTTALSAFSSNAAEKKLILISDFQRTDWIQTPPELPADITLELLQVPRPPEDNCAITNVTCTPLGNHRQRLLVHCVSTAHEETIRPLTLRVGSETQTKEITLPPGKSSRIPFIFQNSEEEATLGLATLSADSFSPDDQYHFTTSNPPPVKVLLILPEDASTDNDAAAFFTRQALEAEQEEIPGRFHVDSIRTSALFGAELSSYQLLFLLGAAERLSSNDLQRIKEYLEAGGTAFHCPGSAPNLSWHNLAQGEISPAYFQGIAGEESLRSNLGIGSLAPDSPLADVFSKDQSSDLFLFTIRKHARLQPTPESKVILRSLTNLPLLLESNVGNGTLYSFAFSFDLSWSDLPLSQSFLPLLRELATAHIPKDFGKIRLYCGGQIPQILRLDGTALQPESPIDTSKPGLGKIGDYFLEINLNPAESSNETLKINDLQRYLQGGNAARPRKPEPNERSRPLNRIFASLFALFFFVEALHRMFRLRPNAEK